MSIFSSIGNVVKSIGGSLLGTAKTAVPGIVSGGLLGGAMSALPSILGAGKAMKSLPPLPGVGGSGGGRIIGGAISMAGSAARGIGSAMRGAASMCARYPQWCLAAGGVTAIASMMQSGQLPIPKRRRRRGITPRDLASFRRVAGLIKSYGPTARRVPSRCAPRKGCK